MGNKTPKNYANHDYLILVDRKEHKIEKYNKNFKLLRVHSFERSGYAIICIKHKYDKTIILMANGTRDAEYIIVFDKFLRPIFQNEYRYRYDIFKTMEYIEYKNHYMLFIFCYFGVFRINLYDGSISVHLKYEILPNSTKCFARGGDMYSIDGNLSVSSIYKLTDKMTKADFSWFPVLFDGAICKDIIFINRDEILLIKGLMTWYPGYGSYVHGYEIDFYSKGGIFKLFENEFFNSTSLTFCYDNDLDTLIVLDTGDDFKEFYTLYFLTRGKRQDDWSMKLKQYPEKGFYNRLVPPDLLCSHDNIIIRHKHLKVINKYTLEVVFENTGVSQDINVFFDSEWEEDLYKLLAGENYLKKFSGDILCLVLSYLKN
jgi:hypothetical protein